jgi:hypothetical protein
MGRGGALPAAQLAQQVVEEGPADEALVAAYVSAPGEGDGGFAAVAAPVLAAAAAEEVPVASPVEAS